MIQFPKSAWWLLTCGSAASFATLGCGAGDPGAADVASAEKAGSIGLELQLANGSTLNSASYTLTGPHGFSDAKGIDLTNATKISATIGGVPAGDGYAITISATTTDGGTVCAGSASLNVKAGQTTTVPVAVECREAPKTGSVGVQGVVNVCPAIDGLSALPAAIFLGGTARLEAQAHDSDSGPARLTYRWSASSGMLAGATEAVRSFTCTAPGSATVTLTASDGDAACDASQSVSIECSTDVSAAFYTTKTPYRPQQDAATYEPAPSGFSTVFTELVARHGSRGLSSVKYDAAALNMWKKASEDGALTALGATLGDDITRLMKANALLDFGVAGITTPGYGNLTQVGIGEQRQLAGRLRQRQAAYFASLSASSTSSPRTLQVVSSGVDRAVDSAAFFAQALTKDDAGLVSLLAYPPAPTGYPANAPVVQPAGTNRFLLYFHKLAAKTDLVTSPSDPFLRTYQDSLAYQAYATNADVAAKLSAIASDPSAKAAARSVLEGLFSKSFVDKSTTRPTASPTPARMPSRATTASTRPA